MSSKFDCCKCSYNYEQHTSGVKEGNLVLYCPGENIFSTFTPTDYYKKYHMSEQQNSETARLIQAALSGSRGEDQKRIAEQGVDFIGTLLRKNNDYGSSVWKRPLLAPNTDVAAAILVRMTDKVERLISLQSKAAEVVSESFDDTMKDLGAYALLYLARPKKDGQPKP
jgi:hypothetical protein